MNLLLLMSATPAPPAPSPPPVPLPVVLVDSDTSSWWSDWGSDVLPVAGSLAVAMIALFGVLLANRHAGNVAVATQFRQEKVPAMTGLVVACTELMLAVDKWLWVTEQRLNGVTVEEKHMNQVEDALNDADRGFRTARVVASAYTSSTVLEQVDRIQAICMLPIREARESAATSSVVRRIRDANTAKARDLIDALGRDIGRELNELGRTGRPDGAPPHSKERKS